MQNQGHSVFPKSPLPGREGEGRGIAELCIRRLPIIQHRLHHTFTTHRRQAHVPAVLDEALRSSTCLCRAHATDGRRAASHDGLDDGPFQAPPGTTCDDSCSGAVPAGSPPDVVQHARHQELADRGPSSVRSGGLWRHTVVEHGRGGGLTTGSSPSLRGLRCSLRGELSE